MQRFGGSFLLVAGVLTLLTAAMQAQSAGSPQAAPATPPAKHSSTHERKQYNSDGERIFAQNCSRCHTAPAGFSERISGTVLRHMRVRASLSKHDEQELLRFLNP